MIINQNTDIPPTNPPSLQIKVSDNFGQWLRHNNISLGFTTYQTNRLIFVGTKYDNTLTLNERLFDKPMGLYTHNDSLYIATRYQVWRLDNLLREEEKYQGFDRLYVPSVGYTTGGLNVHDVVVDENEQLLFVNTDFSCLATIEKGYSFKPVWQPSFIRELRSEDSCHLNGLALVEGKATYMTACSATNNPAGWRNCRLDGGIVLHIPSNEIITDGLSMPHSPRWYQGKLWLLNAGTGDLGYIDNNKFISLTFCPGFVRGLAFWQNYAFVGLSKLRSSSFTGLTLENRLLEKGINAQCGLIVIDINSGNIVHSLYFHDTIDELFDVVVLPNILSPKALGFQDEDIERLITFPDSKGIVITKPTVKRPSIGEKAPIAGLPNQQRLAEERAIVSHESIKYQRVYHLNPDSLAPYDSMTFPSLQNRWQTQPQRGELVGISASIAGDMVGFLIGELLPNFILEIISLFVTSSYRQQGIATKMMILLEKELIKEKCQGIQIIYPSSQDFDRAAPFHDRTLTTLLLKLGWQSPISLNNNQKQAFKSLSAVGDRIKLIPSSNQDVSINLSQNPSQNLTTPSTKQTKKKQKKGKGFQSVVTSPPVKHPPAINQPSATTYVNPQAKLKFEEGKQKFKSQDFEGSIKCFRESIKLQSNYIPPYNQLGNALQMLGKTEEAIQAYQKLLTINPNVAPAYNNLGSCLQIQNRIKEAIQAYHKAIQLKPDFNQAYSNLAILFSNQGKFQEAENCLRQILSLKPNNPEIYYELGNLFRSIGRNDEAIESFRHAIKLNPDYSKAYQNLGCMLMMRNQIGIAQSCFEKVLKLEPNNAECYGNYANVLEAQDHFSLALQAYDRALTLKPEAINLLYQKENLRLTICDWQDFDSRMELLEREIRNYLQEKKNPLLVPLVLNTFNFPIPLHRQINQQWGYHVTHNMTQMKQQNPFTLRLYRKEKLRIGYVSADFRCHAMGVLIHQMFEHHDRTSFEVYCYAISDYEDDMTTIIKQGCDRFVNITALPPQVAAETIYQDEIDILIDLMGYTNLSRPQIFALQPAPIQIAYLGHPNTMGADFIQYILADEIIIPPALEKYYTEEIIALPHAFVASPLETSTKTFTRADFGLPENAFVYGCFNRSNKLNPHLFSIWLEILRQVPDSVLWFLEDHQEVIENLQNQAKIAGIDTKRLIFSSKLPITEFSTACSLADLFLDSYSYNAGSTAVCALWGGLPILTCTGDIFVSRMGASICKSVGLESLICNTVVEYQAKAIELGQNPLALSQLKEYLLTQKHKLPLFNTKQWITTVETSLKAIWEDFLTINSGQEKSSPQYQFSLGRKRKGQGNLFTIMKNPPFFPLIRGEGNKQQEVLKYSNYSLLQCIPKIRLICATRETKDNFFSKTSLGRSLLKYNVPPLEVKLFTENTLGLSIVYNRIIEESVNDPAILIFIHDDIYINDPHWVNKTVKALKVFDIVGVAGNKRRLPQQPNWYFTDTQFIPDSNENLSGIVYHQKESVSQPSLFGAFFEPVKLLDGLMLICHSQTLVTNDIRFDEQFDFHFYDMDFCRQGEMKNLTMGTWNIFVTHDSGGNFGDEKFRSNYDKYLQKWGE